MDRGDLEAIDNHPRPSEWFNGEEVIPGRDQSAFDPLAVHGGDHALALKIEDGVRGHGEAPRMSADPSSEVRMPG